MRSLDLQLSPPPLFIGWKSTGSTMRFSRARLPPLSIPAYPLREDCRLWPLKSTRLNICTPYPRSICFAMENFLPDEMLLEDLTYEGTLEMNVLTWAIKPIFYVLVLNLAVAILVDLPVIFGGGDKSMVILLNNKAALSIASLLSLREKLMKFGFMLSVLLVAVCFRLGAVHLHEVEKNIFKRQNQSPNTDSDDASRSIAYEPKV